MSGNSFIIDTNIVLYILNGNKELAKMLNNKEIYVSFVTELELLGYKDITKDDKKTIGNFLNDCTIIDIYTRIKTYTLDIKQKQKVKLPDAIIAATALFLDIPLITADKGFKKIKGIKLNLFEVSS